MCRESYFEIPDPRLMEQLRQAAKRDAEVRGPDARNEPEGERHARDTSCGPDGPVDTGPCVMD
ncbi:MAG TPA: hypothetical protein VJJ22_00205 [Candidatus Paceibacterota bacterium]